MPGIQGLNGYRVYVIAPVPGDVAKLEGPLPFRSKPWNCTRDPHG